MVKSGTRLIPERFCLLDPLDELYTLRNNAFSSMSVLGDIVWD